MLPPGPDPSTPGESLPSNPPSMALASPRGGPMSPRSPGGGTKFLPKTGCASEQGKYQRLRRKPGFEKAKDCIAISDRPIGKFGEDCYFEFKIEKGKYRFTVGYTQQPDATYTDPPSLAQLTPVALIRSDGHCFTNKTGWKKDPDHKPTTELVTCHLSTLSRLNFSMRF